ncbi:hypothetical protein [Psychroserpens jangbogonensis]|uniref:hypothetical protein n=1 Tax=Psychroserpens jangbogonensis TaxID=1484460 RepID=UPI00053DA424|nr:hypothetical protein [Psychroserpens jangbogonensis]
MKRIDDKIKEIEKKDKTSRWLYYVIIAGVIGFIYFASTTRKEIGLKNVEISDLKITQSKIYKDLDSVNNQTQKLYNDLKNSLRPEEYWKHIKNDNTVEGYIGYITNDWGINKEPYIPNAIAAVKSNNAIGLNGWLFVGSKKNDGIYKSRTDIIEVIYRKGSNGNIATSEPQVGDIVRLKNTRNRITYKRKDKVGRRNHSNDQGFRNKTKAVVVDVYKETGNTNFNVKIWYY